MSDFNLHTESINKILNARYVPDGQKHLKDFLTDREQTKEKADVLLGILLEQISDSDLDNIYPLFPRFKIPQPILDRNKVVRKYVQQIVEQLLDENKKSLLSAEMVENFFIEHHENIKWAQNRWLIASPGLSLELLTISEQLHPYFVKWLKKEFNVRVGDPVVHLHVISNNGRQRLKDMGISVLHEHWHEEYFKEMNRYTLEIARSWSSCKGLFCDSSWIFNPDNFTVAPDGKPFVAFTFLNNPVLYGYIIDVTNLVSKADLKTQEGFALRSERRRKYFDQEIFSVKVHGSFYPVDEMVKNQVFFH
jgi:hypothetical protein